MTEELIAKDKEIVVPGELLATGMSFLPSKGCYRQGEHIYAGRLGLLNVEGKVLKMTPVSGRYLPHVGDTIIARVNDVLMMGWRVWTNSPYEAVLNVKEASGEFIPPSSDLTQIYSIGDLIVCQIINVTSQNLIDVTMRGPGLRKLGSGRIITVCASKVPRIIGKNASMVNMLRDATGVRLHIGQNGVVWMSGEPENEIVVAEAIELIEKEAHTTGLTDRIKVWLEKQKSRIVAFEPVKEEQAPESGGFEGGEGGGFREDRGFRGGGQRGGFGGERRGPPRGPPPRRGGF